jgi:HlyD family secretion protein
MRRIALIAAAVLALAGCEKSDPNVWQGYVEGEYAMLASPYAGQLQKLYVKRGDQVEAGKPVFALEQEQERAMRAEAEERVKSAQAKLENLKEARRPPEIAALQEQVNAARAAREFSRTQLAREEDLMKKGYTTKPRLDEARSAYQRDAARLKEAEAQLRNAQMPVGRSQEREGAEAEMAAAKAALAQAQWRLEQISCDGCQPIEARVSYVSSQAEYTPPVLYSKESRSKLVFLVEARLPKAQLRPGQPIDVRLK